MFISRPERGLETVSRIAVGDTERITEHVRKYAEERGYSETDALRAGMEEKAKEFAGTGSDLYHQA